MTNKEKIEYCINNTDIKVWMTLSEEDQWFVNDRRKQMALEKRAAKKI